MLLKKFTELILPMENMYMEKMGKRVLKMDN